MLLSLWEAIGHKLITYGINSQNNIKFLDMKKINLRGISEILSEQELKNILGGSGGLSYPCKNKKCSGASDCGPYGVCGTCSSTGARHCL